ncbi:MAG: hypothetical protein ACLUFV_01590 [Acutalibacteraceae bacterium]
MKSSERLEGKVVDEFTAMTEFYVGAFGALYPWTTRSLRTTRPTR